MLFTIDKNKSLAFLKAAMAFLILFVPSVLGLFEKETAAYVICFISVLLLLLRIRGTEKIYVCVFHFVMLTLLFYSLAQSVWAGNKGGHLTFLFVIGAVITFFCTALDYFSENQQDTLKRRMMYMLAASGVLCAVLNVLYWIIYIVPVAGKESFSKGLGSNDYLAVFMLLVIFISVLLIKGNTVFRKHTLSFGIAAMLFVFIMAKSIIAWIMAVLLLSVYVIYKKRPKHFFITAIFSIILFLLILIINICATQSGALFKDIFRFSLKNPFGAGGGFYSGAELFKTQNYSENLCGGLFIQLFGVSGILGALCTVAICIWSVMHFIKLKSWESLIEAFVTVMLIFLPFCGNFAVLFLWLGLAAYNEYAQIHMAPRVFRKDALLKISYFLGAVLVVCVFLMLQTVTKISGYIRYESKDYIDSCRLYSVASAMNLSDSQSCYMAAHCLRMDSDIEKNRDDAIKMIEKAIKRDSKNLLYVEEKAKIHFECKEYEEAITEYKNAAKRAILNEKYNLAIAQVLYENIKNFPKGSSEAKRAYEEMQQLANTTENLEYKKMINDIADKTLAYTKGELINEKVGD